MGKGQGPAGLAKDVTEESITEEDKRRNNGGCMLVCHLKLSIWCPIKDCVKKIKENNILTDIHQEPAHENLDGIFPSWDFVMRTDTSNKILNSHSPLSHKFLVYS